MLPSLDFEAFIAKGGMGAVYKARQRSLDRDVAVKILPRELGADPEFRASFETEAKAMARLNHPNLISVYDFGDIDGMPYIVMEYVDGKSLYYSAWNKQIDPKQAVQLVAGICHGLAHAHEAGVIHRDIKPANILLTPKAEPKIGDFGLARPVDYDGPGLVMGTPGYSAPEFLENHEQSDARADLYAVGVILHELVTGQRPDPSGQEPRKPTGNLKLDAIWRKAVQPDPNRRYPTAEAMATALEDWLRNPGPMTAGAPPPAATAAPPKQLLSPAKPAGGKPATPASPATSDQPGKPAPSAVPQVAAASSSNWSLVRNLIIIAVLLVSIGFVWKTLQAKKASNAAENERIQRENYEKQQQARAEAQRRAEEARREAELNRPKPKPKPEIELQPKDETPMESLARLRTDLAAGGRAEMPKGSVRQGNRDIFVVDEPLGWHEAAAFAEAHGGHLAIVGSEDDIIWFTDLIPDDSTVWLGAGRSAGDKWVNIDGTGWALDKDPAGAGDYASLSDLGLLRTRRMTDRFPFIIQWRRDGSNPATLAAMLRRTRETIDDPNPVFPPGTGSQDDRYFAIIPREITRRDAARLAQQAGGTLAVPASRLEADWLESRVSKLDASTGYWLGGLREDDRWTWDTGEPWEFARWSDGADVASGGTAMVLVPGSGWTDASPDETAAGFVIEWSDDGEGSEARAEEMEDADSGLTELQQKAGQLLEQAIKERDDKLSANARTFVWDLDVWFRGLNHGDRDRWEPHLEALKDLVEDDRIPSPDQFGEDSDIELSEQMAKVCTYCYGKQQETDEAHQAKIERIRDAYVERLRSSAADAREKGQEGVANQLRNAALKAEDLDYWVGQMTR